MKPPREPSFKKFDRPRLYVRFWYFYNNEQDELCPRSGRLFIIYPDGKVRGTIPFIGGEGGSGTFNAIPCYMPDRRAKSGTETRLALAKHDRFHAKLGRAVFLGEL